MNGELTMRKIWGVCQFRSPVFFFTISFKQKETRCARITNSSCQVNMFHADVFEFPFPLTCFAGDGLTGW